jgi:arginine decarboxylase
MAKLPNEQGSPPILDGILNYVDRTRSRFHTPGHKGGKGAHVLLKQLMGDAALAADLGLAGDLDNLQEPKSWISRAQELAASLYAADNSFFIVNGTTCGIQAMIMTATSPGEKIIISRNVHKSVAGAIVLSGAIPKFVMPEIDAELNVPLGVTVEAIELMCQAHPDAKAIFLTNPTYHGVASDIKTIVEHAHSRGMLVLIDEAHGPHLPFSSQLPVSAMEAGADLCVQSPHKLLGSLTQSSILHSKGGRIDITRLRSMLCILQSTSPSYLLLASLDIARLQMATQGVALIAQAVSLANQAREQINMINLLRCPGREQIGSPGIFGMDPTKLTVSTRELGFTGSDVEYILNKKYRIQPELSDDNHLLFLITLGDHERDIDNLTKALTEIARQPSRNKTWPSNIASRIAIRPAEQVMSPRDAAFSKRRLVPINSARGEVSAQILSVYPPGIPILWPGERIDGTTIDSIRLALTSGARFVGLTITDKVNLEVVA